MPSSRPASANDLFLTLDAGACFIFLETSPVLSLLPLWEPQGSSSSTETLQGCGLRGDAKQPHASETVLRNCTNDSYLTSSAQRRV